MENSISQAVILAGGFGTRLHPLTLDRPKPMMLCNGRPFLEYIIDLLIVNDIHNILMLLGYLPDKVIDYFDDESKFNAKFEYAVSDPSLKTATRIKLAEKSLAEHFLLLYCDIYWPFDISEIEKQYEKIGLPALCTVYDNRKKDGEHNNLSNLQVENNCLVHYGELVEEKNITGLDIGPHILKKELITNELPANNDIMFQEGFIQKLIEKDKVGAFLTNKSYYTITDINFLKRTEKYLAENHKENLRRIKSSRNDSLKK